MVKRPGAAGMGSLASNQPQYKNLSIIWDPSPGVVLCRFSISGKESPCSKTSIGRDEKIHPLCLKCVKTEKLEQVFGTQWQTLRIGARHQAGSFFRKSGFLLHQQVAALQCEEREREREKDRQTDRDTDRWHVFHLSQRPSHPKCFINFSSVHWCLISWSAASFWGADSSQRSGTGLRENYKSVG